MDSVSCARPAFRSGGAENVAVMSVTIEGDDETTMPTMTDKTGWLIEAIIRNDMPRARELARMVVDEDTSKKNERICAEYRKKLDPELNPELVEMPYQIRGMLQAENLDETFRADRYYLSERDATLVHHMTTRRLVAEQLEQMGVRYRNAALLYGASGTGKTMLARYIAHAFDLPLYYLNFSRLVDSLMGKTSSNIANVFDYVKTIPCVFMLDEIDAISCKRSAEVGSAAGEETNRMTITLLQEFDRLSCKQVVLAATNRIDVVDTALARRFSMMHKVKPLDLYETECMLRLFFDSCKVVVSELELYNICVACDGKPQAKAIEAAIDFLAKRIIEEGRLMK